MKRIGLSVALAFLAMLPLHAADWSAVVKRVETSLVYVENDEGSCTGFVIDTARKYVMTAAHCDGKEIYADRVVAKVLAKDTHEDLMVLKVEDLDPSRTALTLASKNPDIQESVMACGYGYGLERPFYRSARVSDNAVVIPGINGVFIGTDAPFIAGMSGGAVVNGSSDIVSIVQRSDGSALGIGVGAEVIRARMGRFFGAAK